MDLKDVRYLCRECAQKSGCRAREGHAASTHVDKCGVCGERKRLFHRLDVIWPGEPEVPAELLD